MNNSKTLPIKLAEEQVCDYFGSGGVRCPQCKSEDIEGQHIEIDESTATQTVDCLNPTCGLRWTDSYRLDSFRIYNEEKTDWIDYERQADPPSFNERELPTVLAALRLFQQDRAAAIIRFKQEGYFYDHQPLTTEEVDSLCERINV